jgi:hypothetical protein
MGLRPGLSSPVTTGLDFVMVVLTRTLKAQVICRTSTNVAGNAASLGYVLGEIVPDFGKLLLR